jgi:hypothetical protein
MVTQVEVFWALNTTFGTAQDLTFGLFCVRPYTVAPTGGTQATFTATQTIGANKFDSLFPVTNFATSTTVTSGFGDIRICTASNLTATIGCGTVDLWPMRYFGGNANTIGVGPSTWSPFAMGEDPNSQALWLRNQEGFIIQPMATMGATGILDFYVAVEWIEMNSELT